MAELFSGGATIVRSFEGSNTTITGGSFTNSVYPAVDVNGETLITGGIFYEYVLQQVR